MIPFRISFVCDKNTFKAPPQNSIEIDEKNPLKSPATSILFSHLSFVERRHRYGGWGGGVAGAIPLTLSFICVARIKPHPSATNENILGNYLATLSVHYIVVVAPLTATLSRSMLVFSRRTYTCLGNSQKSEILLRVAPIWKEFLLTVALTRAPCSTARESSSKLICQMLLLEFGIGSRPGRIKRHPTSSTVAFLD